MALRARLGRVDLPPEIGAGVGKLRLFPHRLLAHERLIPSEKIEFASALENDELPPSVGNEGPLRELLFAKIGIEAAAALHRAGVKDAGFENVGLRLPDSCARLRGARRRGKPGPH